MSPEAAAGRFQDLGPPADVYGLGATLYHLLTGQPPFGGEGTDEVIRKVLHEEPARPRALRPELPAELEGIVVQAMAKVPARRYPTASALAADLGRFLAGQTPDAPVLSRRRRAGRWLARHRARFAAAVGVLVLAAALVAAGRHLRPRPTDSEEAIRAELADGKVARLLTADGHPRFAAWPLGEDGFEAAADDGGTFGFGSRDAPRVLILLNDPGVESYRFSADLMQVQKVGTGAMLAVSEVGLVLGYAEQPMADGARVHTLMALRFADFDPDARRVLHLIDYGLVTPNRLAPQSIPSVRGVPGLDLDGPGHRWRTVSADVTPAGVWVPGPAGQPYLADTAGINRRRDGPMDPPGRCLRDQVSDPASPVALPPWSPRMPLGIWCRGSWVAIRNVTIEKLP